MVEEKVTSINEMVELKFVSSISFCILNKTYYKIDGLVQIAWFWGFVIVE